MPNNVSSCQHNQKRPKNARLWRTCPTPLFHAKPLWKKPNFWNLALKIPIWQPCAGVKGSISLNPTSVEISRFWNMLKGSAFLDLSWTVTLCLTAWFDSDALIAHVVFSPFPRASAFLSRYQTQVVLAVTSLWSSRKASLFTSKI